MRCMDDRPPALSFASLDAHIEAMPDGPASILKTLRILYLIKIREVTGSGSLVLVV